MQKLCKNIGIEIGTLICGKIIAQRVKSISSDGVKLSNDGKIENKETRMLRLNM